MLLCPLILHSIHICIPSILHHVHSVLFHIHSILPYIHSILLHIYSVLFHIYSILLQIHPILLVLFSSSFISFWSSISFLTWPPHASYASGPSYPNSSYSLSEDSVSFIAIFLFCNKLKTQHYIIKILNLYYCTATFLSQTHILPPDFSSVSSSLFLLFFSNSLVNFHLVLIILQFCK